MDIVVKGRKTEVPERFRKHAVEKLDRISKLDGKVISVDVEVSKERNPRLADRADRVEITLNTRGPVIRAEASAADPYAALDMAAAKMDAQLRKAADKRRVHRGRTPISVGAAMAAVNDSTRIGGATVATMDEIEDLERTDMADKAARTTQGPIEVDGEGPLVVREKVHVAQPMTLDQALYEMELVGHDWYLFVDLASAMPSVVYRRHAYDYGVIQLKSEEGGEQVTAPLF